MSEDDEESPLNISGGIGTGLVKIGRYIFVEPLKMTIGAVGSVVMNGIFAFLPSVFSVIIMILKPIFIVLYYILFKIVPFLVTYIGIPLFILGAVMAIMFMGGHMLMIVVFIVGLYLYIKGLFNIKLVSGTQTSMQSIQSMQNTNNNRDVLKIKR